MNIKGLKNSGKYGHILYWLITISGTRFNFEASLNQLTIFSLSILGFVILLLLIILFIANTLYNLKEKKKIVGAKAVIFKI